ncbi:molybdopterin molybdotransferase MoeA [Salana multivorans]
MSLVPVADQLARVLAEASALPERSLPLAAALGARLSRDVTTATAVPPWDNSAMDGYAVRHEDVADASPEHPVRLRVVADLPAGSPDDPRIGPGEAVRIMTGATLPSDADTIVQLEHTDRDDPLAPLAADVTVLRAPRRGEHVRRAGEDRQVGDPAASAGTLVTGAVAAALSSVGAGTVWVHERPRVAVLATGSELVTPGTPLRRGQIPDSNSLLLRGLAEEAGADVVAVEHVPDDPGQLLRIVEDLRSRGDRAPHVLVLAGGVSQGAYEPVKQAFGAADSGVLFTKVAMQPGKPQAFGRLGSDGPLVFGLPGNPVSAWVSFHVFVRPALLAMSGARGDAVNPAPTQALVEIGWRTPGGRDQVLPARVWDLPDGPRLAPVAALGSKSHLAASLAGANGYALVPAGQQDRHGDGRVHPGDVVDVVRLGLELPPALDQR